MIEYVTPALAYHLSQLGVREEYIATAAGFLIRCWSKKTCVGAGPYVQLCRNDPVCEYIKYVIERRDLDGAKKAFSWYIKCTGKRLIKALDINGRITYYDYTDEFLRKWPPVPFECRRNV